MLQQLDDPHQVFASVVANIVDCVRAGAPAGLGLAVIGGRSVEAGDDAPNDVVDVGEVAPHLTAVEQGQRLPGVKRLDEDPHRHVGTAPRPVNGEEAKPRQR